MSSTSNREMTLHIDDTGPVAVAANVVRFSVFQQGISKASLGVALIRNTKTRTTICSGWLITDRLLVVPDTRRTVSKTDLTTETVDEFFINKTVHKSIPLECYFTDAKNQLTVSSARIINSNYVSLSLIELDTPVQESAVTLNMNSMENITDFYMMYFPKGQIPLELGIAQFLKKTEHLFYYAKFTSDCIEGTPIFSFDGKIIGMHIGRYGHDYAAVSLRTMLSYLQKSRYWNDIARFHNLPEIKSKAQLKIESAKEEKEKKNQQQILSQYAVRWNIHPKKIPASHRKILEKYIEDIDGSSASIMDEEDRIQLIQQMGNLRKLRIARGKDVINEPGQKVIDTILKGPPFRIQKIDEQALPYWLQATAWFEGVVPKLPSRREISAELQRRRHRSRLERSAGPDFRGRIDELKKLKKWYSEPATGAMIISGIGGIGKSALISKFALDLPKNNILFWLDFDRADLAPDKGISVLRVLSEQLSFQVNDYTSPEMSTQKWEPMAEELGKKLDGYSCSNIPALLVLDGFEVAQHSKKYNEIWPLLEILLDKAEGLKVIVSGRASVDGLKLNDKPSEYLPLTGLEEDAAKQWMEKHGIISKQIISKTYKISKGIPLSLKLAVRYIDEGGKMSDLPDELPNMMVEGFLYQRICNRVINPKLRNIITDILVLRVISPEIVEEILSDNLPDKMSASQVFESILREMSLVPEVEFVTDNTGTQSAATMVNIRPEVRAASLRLLELQDEKRVRTIDERAIKFYKKKKKPQDAEKIELIYHYLRTGKLKEAEKLWQQDYITSLNANVEDIPEKFIEVRKWLHSKTGDAPLEMELRDWEADAYNRIKAFRIRGNLDAIPGVLKERTERTENSRLLIYDAWQLKIEDRYDDALKLLNPAGQFNKLMSPVVYYDRQMIAARITQHVNDIEQSKHILASLRETSKANIQRFLKPINLLSIAPQIMFATVEQLKKEIQLLDLLTKRSDIYKTVETLQRIIPFSDFILQELQVLSSSFKEASSHKLKIPDAPSKKRNFIKQLGQLRNIHGITDEYQKLLGEKEYDQEVVNTLIKEQTRFYTKKVKPEKEVKLASEISMLAWERWNLALSGYWLNNVMRISNVQNQKDLRTAFSVLPAYASFRGISMMAQANIRHLPAISSIDNLVEYMMKNFIKKFPSDPIYVEGEAIETAIRYLGIIPTNLKDLKKIHQNLLGLMSIPPGARNLSIHELLTVNDSGIRTVLFILLMPNSIEVTANDILGLPYIFANEHYLLQKRFL